MPHFNRNKALFIILLLGLQACTRGGDGTTVANVIGQWQTSHDAEIAAMSAEEKQFYENLSEAKKEEIEKNNRVVYYFHKDGRFEKKHQQKTDQGRWQLSQDKKQLTIIYNDGQKDQLIVKKLLSNKIRVGKEFGLHKDDIILEPY